MVSRVFFVREMDFCGIENRPYVVNFGCRLNACESEIIEKIACKLGLSNHIIVNSCAVTAEAERQVRQAIRKIHKENPFAKIIVTGCASEASEEIFENLEGVIGIVKNSEKLFEESYFKFASPTRSAIEYKDKPNVRGFVQIQNGCDNFCTYCIVRKTRGPSISLHPNLIVEMTKRELENANVKEIVLTGVNISSYNFNGLTLTNLCRFLLNQIPNLERLRLSSLDPADLDEDFIDFVTSEGRLMSHLHLSIQSGDNMILKRMRRRHTAEDVIKLTNKILEKRNVIFGSDFIAGFPTETEEMHQNTEKFLTDANITLAHIFPYSERPGTPAAMMPQVDKNIRKQRAKRLIEEADKLLENKLNQYVNSKFYVLAETDCFGKTDDFLPVVTDEKFVPGTIYNVTGKAVKDHKLLVEIIK